MFGSLKALKTLKRKLIGMVLTVAFFVASVALPLAVSTVRPSIAFKRAGRFSATRSMTLYRTYKIY